MIRGRHVTPRISKLLAIPSIQAVRRPASVVLLLVLGSGVPASPLCAQEPTVRQREEAQRAFTARVNDYIELRTSLDRGVPTVKPGDASTGRADQVQETMAARIQVARRDARVGDIFGSEGAFIKQTIERDTKVRGMRDAFNAMQEVPAKSPPAVNAVYPESAALATVPALILVNLPRLPDGLEYRFMGRDLILRDREANVIVDFVPGAVPVLKP